MKNGSLSLWEQLSRSRLAGEARRCVRDSCVVDTHVLLEAVRRMAVGSRGYFR